MTFFVILLLVAVVMGLDTLRLVRHGGSPRCAPRSHHHDTRFGPPAAW